VGNRQSPLPDPNLARLHEQAQAALGRWADAVAAATNQQGFVPVGELTGQVGDWEPATGGNNKSALMAGMVEATTVLPADIPPDGSVQWLDGTTRAVKLISAQQAVEELRAGSSGSCPECFPLEITAARLTSGPVSTSRGPATGPLWEFTVAGTAVRVTEVAIAGKIAVEPAPWNPNDPPVGLSIESATGATGARQLTVAFTGAPGPGDQRCGADYTAEAVESDTAIVVIVIEHPYGVVEACTAVGARRTADVELAAPLGDRAVLEVKQGLPVAVVLTP
jgi:hypothetical protein